MKRDMNLDAEMKIFGEWMADAVRKSDNLRIPSKPKEAAKDLQAHVNALRFGREGRAL